MDKSCFHSATQEAKLTHRVHCSSGEMCSRSGPLTTCVLAESLTGTKKERMMRLVRQEMLMKSRRNRYHRCRSNRSERPGLSSKAYKTRYRKQMTKWKK
eukprot:COSAG01_NODE_152_length_23937_cov_122.193976_28_plen_99_part_00